MPHHKKAWGKIIIWVNEEEKCQYMQPKMILILWCVVFLGVGFGLVFFFVCLGVFVSFWGCFFVFAFVWVFFGLLIIFPFLFPFGTEKK